jgi:hypothetical protein
MPQVEPYVACDVDQNPVSNSKWSERPNADEMEQVMELLALIDRRRLDGVIVAANFTFRSKERAHLGYEFRGQIDGTREVPEEIDQDEAKQRISMMFNLTGHLRIND